LWQALREGPKRLTHKQIVGLAGVVYRKLALSGEDDPGPASLWSKALRFFVEIDEGKHGFSDLMIEPRRDDARQGALRFHYGPFADALLSSEGVVTDAESRERLIEELHRTLPQVAAKLRRNAEGDYTPDATAGRFPPWQSHKPTTPQGTSGHTLMGLVEDWWTEAKALKRKPSTYESYRHTMKSFVAFVGHDDPGRVTKEDVLEFKNYRLSSVNPKTGQPISPKTVKDSDLAGLRAVFGWAVANLRMKDNPAEDVKLKLRKQRRLRQKGFTEKEALAILSMASAHEQGQEAHQTFEAKRWVPWLCAYTGARVGEMSQLRKQDIRREGKSWVATIV
jgi:hypothetical protein